MPVNLPSHGHGQGQGQGQGYTDLNFLLPELAQHIEYRKGPYFAKSSDFSSAGAADIEYRTRLDAPFAQLTLAAHGYRRGVLGGAGTLTPDSTVLAAVELMGNDGPWTVKEGLHRANGVLSASGGTAGPRPRGCCWTPIWPGRTPASRMAKLATAAASPTR